MIFLELFEILLDFLNDFLVFIELLVKLFCAFFNEHKLLAKSPFCFISDFVHPFLYFFIDIFLKEIELSYQYLHSIPKIIAVFITRLNHFNNFTLHVFESYQVPTLCTNHIHINLLQLPLYLLCVFLLLLRNFNFLFLFFQDFFNFLMLNSLLLNKWILRFQFWFIIILRFSIKFLDCFLTYKRI